MSANEGQSPLEDWTGIFGAPGKMLHIKRDDLLPFPMAGNKFRKLSAEFAFIDPYEHVIITVGSVTSNHCRTTAMLAARHGIPVRLILHDQGLTENAISLGTKLLSELNAVISVVSPEAIAAEIKVAEQDIRSTGKTPYVIAGGCHTPAGVQAYVDVMNELAGQIDVAPDIIVVPSGTGATQAGIVIGCRQLGWKTRVIGISVARGGARGSAAVLEAVKWLNSEFQGEIEFSDQYTAGGYAKHDAATNEAVAKGWAKGLPLDLTYTGKAFAAVLDLLGSPSWPKRIVFWHTGGLFQYLSDSGG